jgi:hypothetical protein
VQQLVELPAVLVAAQHPGQPEGGQAGGPGGGAAVDVQGGAASVVDDGDVPPGAQGEFVAPVGDGGVEVDGVDAPLQFAAAGEAEGDDGLVGIAAGPARLAARAPAAEECGPGVAGGVPVLGELEERLDGVTGAEGRRVQRDVVAGAQIGAAQRGVVAAEAETGVAGLVGVVLGRPAEGGGGVRPGASTLVRSLPRPVRPGRCRGRRRSASRRRCRGPASGRRAGRAARGRARSRRSASRSRREAEAVLGPVSSGEDPVNGRGPRGAGSRGIRPAAFRTPVRGRIEGASGRPGAVRPATRLLFGGRVRLTTGKLPVRQM